MEEKMKKDRLMEGVFDSYPDVVSVEEIQQMLRIGKNAVYTLLKDGEIKSIKVGKRYIVPKKYVVEFLIKK
jgi:excisionase family DNA binding protein